MRASKLLKTAKKHAQNNGMAHEFDLNPTKAVCNNCDTTVSYDIPKAPAALLITLTDSMSGEVFMCPNCGPIGEDSLDGVTIE